MLKLHDLYMDEVSATTTSLHPKLEKIINAFPPSLQELKNVVFYGPTGVGKYTHLLNSIRKYSSSNLKYDRKISVIYNKQQYIFKVSDIHYEIDMALLGCNSKLLWHEIYQQIIDIICTKPDKSGIIVCKNFHEIHNELLENFYSYMQQHIHIHVNLKYMILTQQISFIPENILRCCEVIHFNRPTKIAYSKCCHRKIPKHVKLEHVSNIKMLLHQSKASSSSLLIPHKIICDKIIHQITNIKTLHFSKFRDMLYDLFIYNFDISECIYYILSDLAQKHLFTHEQFTQILIKTYIFFQYYNNNYRPIFHIEHYFLYLSKIINKL